jgi:gliding motility-associated-like protein
LSYLWTASTGVAVDPVKYPLVQPLVHTKYYVQANLGKCQDHDSVYVKVAPYPQVDATDVAPICFGDKVQLNATIVGSSFSWTPVASLLNANTLHPIAGPSKTTMYILSVTDTVGCPKPVKDTVTVVVIPPITANAGKDTSVVINQPLQMFVATNAGTGSHFLWTPSFYLNNDTLQNPVATINITADSIKYHILVTTKEGCIGQDDIVVRVFKTEPDIFVPTAFTPNKDGKNDILKPICVGIVKLDYFRVFNRWGQMLFETREFDKGWDGSFGGTQQQSGTYVFMAQGTDYAGKVVFRKGTAVLIQ